MTSWRRFRGDNAQVFAHRREHISTGKRFLHPFLTPSLDPLQSPQCLWPIEEAFHILTPVVMVTVEKELGAFEL